ncbi:hypothetical protein RUND412_003783 [Rhizina undulata]
MVSSSFLSLGIAFFAALTTAFPVNIERRDSPLKVLLSASSQNAVVHAEITNTGSSDLSLLSYGSILASKPVEKVEVYLDGICKIARLQFNGILYHYDLENIAPDHYVTIKSGETYKTTVELAGLYDLSSSGPYKTTPLIYESNTLELTVDVEAASKVESLISALEKRVVVTGCTGTKRTALVAALSNAVTLASGAATAASSDSSSKFSEYFGTTSSSIRSTVAARFSAVASAASTTSSGSVRYYCTDPYGYCDSNTIAWTLPSTNVIANCDYFYDSLSDITSTCHAQDRVTTVIHELTHAPAVYSPGTDDNAYGYSASIALSTSQAVLNADTYALYSQAIYLGC